LNAGVDGTTMVQCEESNGSIKEGVLMINTVADKASTYSKREYDRAREARKLQAAIGYPSLQDYTYLIENNLLRDCLLTVMDVRNAEDIFGPSVAALKGKMIRRGGTTVQGNIVRLPREIMERYRSITLCGDVMFVNGMAFFITVGKSIQFGTIENMVDRPASTIYVYNRSSTDL
jgi:hypothetical protein